jgi:hypothetical protein
VVTEKELKQNSDPGIDMGLLVGYQFLDWFAVLSAETIGWLIESDIPRTIVETCHSYIKKRTLAGISGLDCVTKSQCRK